MINNFAQMVLRYPPPIRNPAAIQEQNICPINPIKVTGQPKMGNRKNNIPTTIKTSPTTAIIRQ
jgi:hypothetical protein